MCVLIVAAMTRVFLIPLFLYFVNVWHLKKSRKQHEKLAWLDERPKFILWTKLSNHAKRKLLCQDIVRFCSLYQLPYIHRSSTCCLFSLLLFVFPFQVVDEGWNITGYWASGEFIGNKKIPNTNYSCLLVFLLFLFGMPLSVRLPCFAENYSDHMLNKHLLAWIFDGK